jgi:prolyl-tRNA editing enzyme YbaK/EbsC (Cys-tRNA(Pro) deacylase)
MKISAKLLSHLQKNKVKHDVLEHRTTFTGYDTSQTLRAKLGEVVKGLLVKADKEIHLVLIQADKMLDLKKLAKLLQAKKVEIIKENAMTKLLKKKKPGALHGFASLYKLPLIVENNITKLKEAIFPTGSFNHHLKLKVKDFLNLEQPQKVGSFSMVKKAKKLKPAKKKK